MVLKVAFLAAGIYACYLTWAVLQERISTVAYVNELGEEERFNYFIFLNLCQSVMSTVLAYVFLFYKGVSLANTSSSVIKGILICAILHSLGSPFGYEALKHINYPTVILGKSCKLVPVMIMNFVVYRKKFDWHKYVTVFLITAGVSGFMLFEPHKKESRATETLNSFYGLILLLINLFIDGAVNSFQDKIYIQHKISSQKMMFYMNLFASLFMIAWLSNPFNPELTDALAFTSKYPAVLLDIFMFCICSALGQKFIYYTIEQFGSLSLVTITVTRKLFTMLISLFYFNHKLTVPQWMCVALVFVALGIETAIKLRNPKPQKAKK